MYDQKSNSVDLSSQPTCSLVNELIKHEGVKARTVEPYQGLDLKVEGPAIVLVVTD